MLGHKKNMLSRLQSLITAADYQCKILDEHEFQQSDTSKQLALCSQQLIELAKEAEETKSSEEIQKLSKKIDTLTTDIHYLENQAKRIIEDNPADVFLTCCQDETLFFDLMKNDPAYVDAQIAKLRHEHVYKKHRQPNFDYYEFRAPFLQFSVEKIISSLDPSHSDYQNLFGAMKQTDQMVPFDFVAISELEPLFHDQLMDLKQKLLDAKHDGFPYKQTLDLTFHYLKLSEQIHIYKFMKSLLENYVGMSEIGNFKDMIREGLALYDQKLFERGTKLLYEALDKYRGTLENSIKLPIDLFGVRFTSLRNTIFGEREEGYFALRFIPEIPSIDRMILVPQFNELSLTAFTQFRPGNVYPMGIVPLAHGFGTADDLYYSGFQFALHDVNHAEIQLAEAPRSNADSYPNLGNLDRTRMNSQIQKIVENYMRRLIITDDEKKYIDYIDAILFGLTHEHGYNYDTLFRNHIKIFNDLKRGISGYYSTVLTLLKERSLNVDNLQPAIDKLLEIVKAIEKNEGSPEESWLDGIRNQFTLTSAYHAESFVTVCNMIERGYDDYVQSLRRYVTEDLFKNPLNQHTLENFVINNRLTMLKEVCDEYQYRFGAKGIHEFRNSQGKNLFHLAAERGVDDIINYLISLKMPNHLEDNLGKTPLEYYLTHHRENNDIVKLLTKGLSESQLYRAIEQAKQLKNESAFAVLVSIFKMDFAASQVALPDYSSPVIKPSKQGLFSGKKPEELPDPSRKLLEKRLRSLETELEKYESLTKKFTEKARKSQLNSRLFNTRIFADFDEKFKQLEGQFAAGNNNQGLVERFAALKARVGKLHDTQKTVASFTPPNPTSRSQGS